MGFDARSAVEALDYDFTHFDGTAGTTPEPTRVQIRAYQRWLNETIGPSATPGDLSKRYNEITEEEAEELDREACAQLALLTSGQPSADDLLALPARVFRAYWRHLWKELVDPTVSSPATRPSPVAATNGNAAI